MSRDREFLKSNMSNYCNVSLKNGHRKKEQQNSIQITKDWATEALQQTGVNAGYPDGSC